MMLLKSSKCGYATGKSTVYAIKINMIPRSFSEFIETKQQSHAKNIFIAMVYDTLLCPRTIPGVFQTLVQSCDLAH